MYDLNAIHVNLFRDSFHSTPERTVTLQHVLTSIQTGHYATQVRYVREILATQGKSAYDQAKSRLPAITFAGTFASTRGNAHLQQHSGLLHVDMDHLDNADTTKRALSDDPHVVFVFTSPSGGGLKAGVPIPVVTTAEQYAHAWRVVKADFEQRYGVPWDPATKDLARLCFVSFDPELYVNVNAAVFDIPPIPEPVPPPLTPKRPTPMPYQADRRRMYAERAIRTSVQMIQMAPMGSRHHTRLKAARLLGGYVAGGVLTDEEAYSALAQALVGHTEDLKRALDTVEDGLRYGQAYPINLEDLEAERQAWLHAHPKSQSAMHLPTPSTRNPWDGIKTLPIRPFSHHRGIHTQGRRVRDD